MVTEIFLVVLKCASL